MQHYCIDLSNSTMDYPRPCGCKGCRTCLVCEKECGIGEKSQEILYKVNTYLQ